jgi:hypothetical protein
MPHTPGFCIDMKINGLTKKGFVRARKQKAYKSMGDEGGRNLRSDGGKKL